MDAFTAGRLSRTIDTLHSVSYFLPEAAERFGAIGMVGRTPYFAARSAPMGAVGAEVVAAILRRGAESIPNGDGRALYAAHAGLPWPESVHGQLWHAVTLLREYRGDGHIAALITHALGGLEALITHTAAGIGFSVEFARGRRVSTACGNVGWSTTRVCSPPPGPNCVPASRISRTSWRTSRGGRSPMTTATRSPRSRRRSGRRCNQRGPPGGAFGARYGEHR